MDPISFSIELEIGALLLAAVGAVATWLGNRHQKAHRRQIERHHQEMRALHERLHRDNIANLRMEERIAEDCTLPAGKAGREK